MRVGLLLRLAAFLALAGLCAVMEYNTLTGPHVGTSHTYHAVFGGVANLDGVSGLRSGQPVEAAGVAIGKVVSVSLVDASNANVTFTANTDQQLDSHTWATVRYANLLGDRYLELSEQGTGPAQPLAAGGTIPESRTQPALSLTALFNGFRPLFAALTPTQVNHLSDDVISVLQGQTGVIDDLVGQVAGLTTNLANQDQVFASVMDSLSGLLSQVAQHDSNLTQVITTLHALTTQLQADGPGILGSLNGVDNLISSVGGVLGKLEDHNLPGDVSDLNAISGVLASHTSTLNSLIDGFQAAFGDFARVTQNGNWLNANLCNATINTFGSPQINGPAILQALSGLGLGNLTGLLSNLGLSSTLLSVYVPLNAPTGTAGRPNDNTAVCR